MKEEQYYFEIEHLIKKNELIKKWSIKLTETYGKGYNASNLRKFR